MHPPSPPPPPPKKPSHNVKIDSGIPKAIQTLQNEVARLTEELALTNQTLARLIQYQEKTDE